jgi:hypothetical protein
VSCPGVLESFISELLTLFLVEKDSAPFVPRKLLLNYVEAPFGFRVGALLL